MCLQGRREPCCETHLHSQGEGRGLAGINSGRGRGHRGRGSPSALLGALVEVLPLGPPAAFRVLSAGPYSDSDFTGLPVTWAFRFLPFHPSLGDSLCSPGWALLPCSPVVSCLKTWLVSRWLLRLRSCVTFWLCDLGRVQGAGFLVGRTVE